MLTQTAAVLLRFYIAINKSLYLRNNIALKIYIFKL